MEVLDVVNQTTGQVILDLVNDDGRPNVDKLDVGILLLVFIDSLVDLLVVADTVSKILSSKLWILAHVIGRSGLDFEDVVHDDVFVVAF